MSAHTKKQTTRAFAEFHLRVPMREAARARTVLGGLAPLFGSGARLTETDSGLMDIDAIIADIESDDDGTRIPAEEVMPPATPGRMLKGLRLREGFTQKAMAEKIGIKQHHVAEMETEKRSIGIEMAKRIAKTFNVSHRLFL